MKMRKRFTFHKDQVVMVNDWMAKYPVKLKKPVTIAAGPAWYDSLNNVVLERLMRPLTAREMER